MLRQLAIQYLQILETASFSNLPELESRKQGITVEEMRGQIAMRIRKGLSDSDPNRRLQWE